VSELRLQVVQADITTLALDAIVNAANVHLTAGAGVCGAIFRGAGPKLAKACAGLAPCPVGEARVTFGFNLPAKFVIHTVGPTWQGGHEGEDGLLASCYWESLNLAAAQGCKSIAFPAISTGIFAFPAERAARIAAAQCRTWIGLHPQPHGIFLVAFDTASRLRLERALQEH
jgi:O-acetyl-ADP-ribose deacetylase (regulator of RNase III)